MSCESSGIIVIDKPESISSAGVVAAVKKRLKAKKVGHTGTLDPFATGVLVCCINKATRLADFFLKGNKKYEAVLHLGIETDTQDATGNITATGEIDHILEHHITSVIQQFQGEIKQRPPAYSALKHKGVPLYKYARKGQPIFKPERDTFISYINIMDIHLPEIHFEVSCKSGTYVRTLGADIGRALGCGGHLKKLRRIESSGFSIKDAVNFSEIDKISADPPDDLLRKLVSMTDALPNLPEFIASDMLATKIMHGRKITEKDIVLPNINDGGAFIKILDTSHNLIAIVQFNKEESSYTYFCVLSN
jgi:tRNA pseudouridine55 synthase